VALSFTLNGPLGVVSFTLKGCGVAPSLAPLKGSLAATVLEGLCMLRRAKQPFRVSDASWVFEKPNMFALLTSFRPR
jgi:hypothetical protein